SIREELDELIGYELSDPRIGGDVTVAEVHISPDFRHAHVRLVLSGTAEEQAGTLAAIDHARQYLKHQLAERLRLFKPPEVLFEPAREAGLSARVAQILKRVKRGRPR